MKSPKLLLVGIGLALVALIATPATAQDDPSITVEPASVDAAGQATFMVNGTGWTAAPPIFILPCPVPESGDLTELSPDQCDTANLTPATPEDGAFSVEVTYDVAPEGIVVAAGDAAQSQSAAALIRVGSSGDEAASIAQVAADAGDFATLLAALDAAGLADMFADCSGGQYTVFAPTDAAFAAALEALGLSADELLADTELLSSVLTYHVVEGAVLSADVVALDGQAVPTLNGASVAVSVEGDSVMVDDATVVTVDVTACNGVIHVIDTVLLPPAGDDATTDDSGDDAADDTAASGDDTAEDTTLAQTGSESGYVVVVAIAMLVLGGLFVTTERRFIAD